MVAGVFGMHGLTSHHDAAMAVPGAPMSVSAGHQAMPAQHTRPDVVQVVPADEMDGMGGVCLAVLTGLVLVLALLLGLRSLLVWRDVRVAAPALRFLLGERSPPRAGPSLSSLGVLRI
ncbi:hypothetical protein GCM10009804_48230 [Kribbella hippodromi]|uniref:Uncharacterized protein n=1 Tax=Kribbella hippodromi TaxID=434347 RepID=A0ABN2DW21_9ACTN